MSVLAVNSITEIMKTSSRVRSFFINGIEYSVKIEKLQYITYNALNKYPELAYDKKFIKYTTKLNNNLEKNYLKLTKKRNIINKYYSKTNKQIKKLIKKGEKIA